MGTPSRPPRILIADDHPPIRLALRHDLERGGLEVCAEVSTGAEAVNAAMREQPDLCLLDIQMPEGGGLAIFGRELVDVWVKFHAARGRHARLA